MRWGGGVKRDMVMHTNYADTEGSGEQDPGTPGPPRHSSSRAWPIPRAHTLYNGQPSSHSSFSSWYRRTKSAYSCDPGAPRCISRGVKPPLSGSVGLATALSNSRTQATRPQLTPLWQGGNKSWRIFYHFHHSCHSPFILSNCQKQKI